MNIVQAVTIFKHIRNDKYTDEEKHEAVLIVAGMETVKSISKGNMIEALRWVVEKEGHNETINLSCRVPANAERFRILSYWQSDSKWRYAHGRNVCRRPPAFWQQGNVAMRASADGDRPFRWEL